ncbi:MAG: PHP domain-containing protein [Ruminococcaceae bacterium]|nr:PHP domain-containing protein [Oscillospiraceae bacterium]
MSRKYLISPEGKFYKAAMHTHSTVSDGRLTPEEVKETYKSMGYSIVAFTDHSRLVCHNDLTDSDFLAINAYEFEVNKGMIGGPGTECYHLNFYAKNPLVDHQVMFDPRNGAWIYSEEEMKTFKIIGEVSKSEHSVEYINKAIKAANENGFLVCYNHPVWSLHTEKDFVPLEGLFAFEIYNHSSQIQEYNGYNPHMYTSLLRAGKSPACFATDDSHMLKAKNLSDPFCDMDGGYIMIKSESLTYESIIDALERRDFYSSTGVEIKELYIEGKNVHIKTSPCTQINLISDTRYAKGVRSLNNDITEAVFSLESDATLFWIICQDEKGRIAATNAASTKI